MIGGSSTGSAVVTNMSTEGSSTSGILIWKNHKLKVRSNIKKSFIYASNQVKFMAKMTHQRFHYDEGKAVQNDSVIIKIIAWLKIRELLTRLSVFRPLKTIGLT